ncbi:conserved hypothetical protein [Trichinella spiralis]|uniref:hypothetical protein n=1 Tax=Trichinella spiralis TaxID=6334 RepID=UPI0001EFB7E4|nr:conserved hypothetical protein [Trichinella spiralis]
MVATADANKYSVDAYSLQIVLLLGHCCTPYLNMTTNNKEKHKSQRLVCNFDQPYLSVQLVPLADENRQISAVKKGSAQQQLNLRNIFELKLHESKYKTKTLAQ